MIKRLLTTLLLLIVITPSVWAETIARTDKTEVVPGESINLTISTTDTDSEAPDLESLKQQFTIIGMQQSTQISLVNGKRSSLRSWTILISPLHTNSKHIIIPSIVVGSEKTNPITIKIIDTPTNLSVNNHDILKIETELSQKTAYIQQQLLLTIRIYIDQQQAQNIRLDQLIPAPLANFKEYKLPHKEYDREINGRLYRVLEYRSTIFPQKSGTLTIDPFALVTTIVKNYTTEHKTITSDKLILKVNPIPSNYPQNTPWLPAENLTLTENWSNTSNNVLQGDTLTRTLTVQAEGLTSNQIGDIPSPTISGIRVYPEKPFLVNKSNGTSPIGIRVEHNVIIPVDTGDIVIPKTKLPWWNTKTNTLEYAELPEHTLHVNVNPAFSNTSPTNNQTNNEHNTNAPATDVKELEDTTLWLWQLATAILAFTTLISFGLWIYARKQPAIIKADSPIINPKTLLDDIKNACKENNPSLARTALDNWVKQQPENLTDLFERHPPLANAVDMLNKALYSEADFAWQGSNLWEAIQSLPPITLINNTTTIPPLYPK